MDTINKDDQFKKLTAAERSKIVDDLISRPEDILCKSMNDLFVVRPQLSKPPNRLLVRFTPKELSVLGGEELICQFLYKKEKLYIFKCHYVLDSDGPCLILDNDFYMIQRRENYRLKFPSGLPSKVTVKNQENQLTGKVFDLSTTGIRVVSTQNNQTIQIGDEVELEIQVAGHESLKIKSHLRHRNEVADGINDKKNGTFYYGFQFHNLSHANEKSLSRINMEMYRNFFQKIG